MSTTQTETALAAVTEHSPELQAVRSQTMAQSEIQSAIIIAKKFPRNSDRAFEDLMRSCSRLSFAIACEYEFPRGKEKVRGPSVHLAREAARSWQNIRYGFDILVDTREKLVIRCYAWDVETNVKVEMDDSFDKLVMRRPKDSEGRITGPAQWVEADERERRELTNRHAAIGVRNCILQLLPRDLVDDAVRKSRATVKARIEEAPDDFRKRIIEAFLQLNVSVEMVEGYLGHPLAQCSPAELDDLRTIWKSIEEGNSTWFDYCRPAGEAQGQDETLAARSAGRLRDALNRTKTNGAANGKGETGGVTEAQRTEAASAQAALNSRRNDSRPEEGMKPAIHGSELFKH